MRIQHLAGLALVAMALLAAIPLSHVRTDPQSPNTAEVAQQDRQSSPASTVP